MKKKKAVIKKITAAKPRAIVKPPPPKPKLVLPKISIDSSERMRFRNTLTSNLWWWSWIVQDKKTELLVQYIWGATEKGARIFRTGKLEWTPRIYWITGRNPRRFRNLEPCNHPELAKLQVEKELSAEFTSDKYYQRVWKKQ
jgi:hypothetical protein